MQVRSCFASVVVGLLSVAAASAQDFDLSAFLDKADRATVEYQRTFRNLVSEEIRFYDYFRPDGSLEDSRRIKSIFIIYDSPKNHVVAEFRNVVEFNGKNVARTDSGIAKFFEKVSDADSSDEEVLRLKKEGNRFDGKSGAYGMTLIGPFVLNQLYRQYFEFMVVGHEKIDGRDVTVIEYKQTKPALTIKANATSEERRQEPRGISFDTDLPANFRPTNPRLSGRLWLDSQNAQLWRNEFFVTIQPPILTARVVSVTFEFQYQASEFGTLLPKRLSIVSYRLSGKGDNDLQRTKWATKIFEYSKFSKPDSQITVTKTSN